MVEFLIIVVPLLLLLLGTLQFGFIYRARLTLDYAAYETARAGALNGARLLFMEQAFANALAPLYTNGFLQQGSAMDDCVSRYDLDLASETGPALGGVGIDQVECGRARVRALLADGRARVVLVNPAPASFDDFGVAFSEARPYDSGSDDHLATARVIPNDHLMYRSARSDGVSGQSIQDANLLKAHVSLCYALSVPLVKGVIRELMTTAPQSMDSLDPGVGGGITTARGFGPLPAGSFGRSCADRGGIPLYATSVMRMHSAAVEQASVCRGACD